MTFVLPLEGFTPPERPPGSALFVSAAIHEGATPVFADSSQIVAPTALDPLPTDPTDPPTYSFLTNQATLDGGWYWVVWRDAAGVDVPSQPVELRPLSPYAPTVGDVALILRARLVETGGERVTTFTADTEPSAQDVHALIGLIAPSVLGRLGDLAALTCATASDLRASARYLVAQLVAIEVELSYRPEEVVESAAAATAERREQVESALTGLISAVEACRAATSDAGSTGRNDAAWSFPRVPYLNW